MIAKLTEVGGRRVGIQMRSWDPGACLGGQAVRGSIGALLLAGGTVAQLRAGSARAQLSTLDAVVPITSGTQRFRVV